MNRPSSHLLVPSLSSPYQRNLPLLVVVLLVWNCTLSFVLYCFIYSSQRGSVWSRLGAETTVIEFTDRIAAGADGEIA